MAFVSYVATVPRVRFSIPPTFTSSFRETTTTSTYVYSRPDPSSFSRSASVQQQPKSSDICSDSTAPVLQPNESEGGQVQRNKRTHFTAYQRGELEKAFSQSQYISPQKRRALSQKLRIPNEVIQIWFKNRRVKWRRENQRRQTEAASTFGSASAGPYLHYFAHVPYPSSQLMINDARMLYGPASSHAQISGEDQD